VALVVSESEARVFGEPFFAAIIRGISAGLSETPLQLWLAMAQSAAERQRVNQHLTLQHVDGVMLLSLHDDDPLPGWLHERGVPAVLGGRPAGMLAANSGYSGSAASGSAQRPGVVADAVTYVDVDNEGGARQAVEHLLSIGRRKIAVVAGPQDMGAGVARLAGYRQAVEAAGLACDDGLVGYGDFSEDSGAAAARELLVRRPDLDALFAASDLMASGAMRVLKESGRRIPDDVAVVGFEDSVVARQTDPPLTTVYQPVEEMGREMARLLTERIRGDAGEGASVLLDTHLVRRVSA
jgi:DNA-binding LacI/PurR family transcriptional regulator